VLASQSGAGDAATEGPAAEPPPADETASAQPMAAGAQPEAAGTDAEQAEAAPEDADEKPARPGFFSRLFGSRSARR
jgi:hypothetical protein